MQFYTQLLARAQYIGVQLVQQKIEGIMRSIYTDKCSVIASIAVSWRILRDKSQDKANMRRKIGNIIDYVRRTTISWLVTDSAQS